MNKLLCLSLGTIRNWKISENRADLIKYTENLDIDGIEISLPNMNTLFGFKVSEKDKKILKKFKYISIHSPFGFSPNSVITETDEEIIKQLEYLNKLYKELGAKNIIFHPIGLPEPKLLDNYKFNYAIENLPPDRKIGIDNMKSIFKKYPKAGFCLDVCHAYKWSKNEINILLKAFGDRLSEIHLAGVRRGKEHRRLQTVSNAYLNSIKIIKDLNVPIIIEEDFQLRNDSLLKKEIKFAKKLLEMKI